MRKQLMALAGLLVMGGVAMAAGPQGPGPRGGRPGPPPGPRGGDMVERLREEVGLSQQQIDQIRQVHLEARKAAIRNRADRAIARMELHEALAADTLDVAAVNARVKQLADLEAAALKARVDVQLAARKVMTPEQFQKARALRRGGPGRPSGEPGRERGPRRGALDLPGDEGMDDEEAEAF